MACFCVIPLPPRPPIEPLVASKEALLLREQEIIDHVRYCYDRDSQSYFGWLWERETKGEGTGLFAGTTQALIDRTHEAALVACRCYMALSEAFEDLKRQPFDTGHASDRIVKLAGDFRKEWAPGATP